MKHQTNCLLIFLLWLFFLKIREQNLQDIKTAGPQSQVLCASTVVERSYNQVSVRLEHIKKKNPTFAATAILAWRWIMLPIPLIHIGSCNLGPEFSENQTTNSNFHIPSRCQTSPKCCTVWILCVKLPWTLSLNKKANMVLIKTSFVVIWSHIFCWESNFTPNIRDKHMSSMSMYTGVTL